MKNTEISKNLKIYIKQVFPADYKKVYGKSIQELEKIGYTMFLWNSPAIEPKAANSQLNEISKTFIMVQQSDKYL